MSAPPTNYVVKRVYFKGKKVPVAMQNVNGPCPLLAVANVLALRGHFTIHEDKSAVTSDELLAAVSDYLFDANSAASDDLQRNYERNLSDVIQMLPKTLVGIDVNLKFDNITSFEFTAEHMLFDFCKVRLVHGWLVDPQDPHYSRHIRKMSYNQLVEKEIIIVGEADKAAEKMANLNINNDKPTDATTPTTSTTTTTASPTSTAGMSSDIAQQQGATETKTSSEKVDDEKLTQALLAERFLNETATQLTYFGLTELHAGLKEDELCVFFRNNHFNTLYKHNGELFLLVTDQGYASTPVMWEKLCQIDGDTYFLRGDFTPYQPTSPELVRDSIRDFETSEPHPNTDGDLALALQLQDEEHQKEGKRRTDDEQKQSKQHKKDKDKDKDHCIVQ